MFHLLESAKSIAALISHSPARSIKVVFEGGLNDRAHVSIINRVRLAWITQNPLYDYCPLQYLESPNKFSFLLLLLSDAFIDSEPMMDY